MAVQVSSMTPWLQFHSPATSTQIDISGRMLSLPNGPPTQKSHLKAARPVGPFCTCTLFHQTAPIQSASYSLYPPCSMEILSTQANPSGVLRTSLPSSVSHTQESTCQQTLFFFFSAL